jgi:A/G-specific adenine glycosylase
VHPAPSGKAPAPPSTPRLVACLLDWFSRHARPLPWRRTHDPYAIWISEIMLQQTQVDAAIPYYERWIRRLPTVADVAAAPHSLLLGLWAGLGYYRRVRHLHSAARLIQDRFQGIFPENYPDVLDLPGIGRYTAGAICSIAFNRPTPVLDGNVMRVLTRLFALPGDPRAQPLNARLWKISQSLVELASGARPARTRPCGQLNQALMELGALICSPWSPRCSVCPLRKLCLAAKSGQPADFPSPRPRPITTIRRFAVLLLRHRSQFLVRRQRESDWNAGLWGFPAFEIGPEPADPGALLLQHFGMRATQFTSLGQVRHSITRYRLLLDVHAAELDDRPPTDCVDNRWCRPASLRKLPFAAAHRKILQLAKL